MILILPCDSPTPGKFSHIKELQRYRSELHLYVVPGTLEAPIGMT